MTKEEAMRLLTPRELELCAMGCRGMSNAQLASEMGIRRESLKKLKKLVRRKLGFRAALYFNI